MMTICTLRQIYPAMKNATDDEVPVLGDGLKMVSESPMTMPLMELEYALNDQALDIVRRHTDIS